MGNTIRFILALMVAVLLPNCMVSTKTTNNISTDQLALLSPKAHVISDLSNVLATNWSTATLFAIGLVSLVVLDTKESRTALNLFGMNLSGTIPQHLGNLSFLAMLNMGNNSFHGSLVLFLYFGPCL
ncbi:hypothetical protein PTKIN_Ptkin14bG0116300 [Pterospermum kingtungense]